MYSSHKVMEMVISSR